MLTEVASDEQASKSELVNPQQAENAERERQKTIPENRGGVAALGVQEESRVQARVSASAGIVQRYAMQVRAALARNKPKGNGIRGTATITFGIAPTGQVRFARLSDPSGNTLLDKAVLSAVRHTAFPKPPDGMTATQLTYVVPFHFK